MNIKLKQCLLEYISCVNCLKDKNLYGSTLADNEIIEAAMLYELVDKNYITEKGMSDIYDIYYQKIEKMSNMFSKDIRRK